MLFSGKVLGTLFLLMWWVPVGVAAAGYEYEFKTPRDVIVVSSGESLTVDHSRRLFKYSAKNYGLLLLESSEKFNTNCNVLVYRGEGKETLVQSSVLKDMQQVKLDFRCEKDEVYYFYWDGLEDAETIDWSLVETSIEGISPLNPISIRSGVFATNHAHKGDSWYEFAVDGDGQYLISSQGLTSENTCLFVYGSDPDVSIASSNSVGKTLQSRVVLNCKAGDKLLIRWSNAFTNASYKWELKLVE